MEIDVLINETPELDLKFVMNDVGGAQIVSLPLGKDYTIAQIKLALAAEVSVPLTIWTKFAP